MSAINISGDPTSGKFNFINYNFTNAQNVSTFNSSLCSVIDSSPTGSTLRVYRPGLAILPFTQFIPGKGYVIRASQNFSIPIAGSVTADVATLQLSGDPSSGKFNIFSYKFLEGANISTYDSSIFIVQRPSSTQSTVVEYRPEATIKPFTTFNTGSGYLVKAKQNFTITGTLPAPTYQIVPTATTINKGDSVTFNITTANVGTATLYYTLSSPNKVLVGSNFIPPPPTFLYSLSGIGSPEVEDAARQINLQNTLSATDKIYYNNYDGTTSTYTSMEIYVNGTARSLVNFTDDRMGDEFGYSISPIASVPTMLDIFSTGIILLSTSDFVTPLQNSVSITNNLGSFTSTTSIDFAVEGIGSFVAQLRTGSASGPVVATSDLIQVLFTSGIQSDSADQGYNGVWSNGNNGGQGFEPWSIYSTITSFEVPPTLNEDLWPLVIYGKGNGDQSTNLIPFYRKTGSIPNWVGVSNSLGDQVYYDNEINNYEQTYNGQNLTRRIVYARFSGGGQTYNWTNTAKLTSQFGDTDFVIARYPVFGFGFSLSGFPYQETQFPSLTGNWTNDSGTSPAGQFTKIPTRGAGAFITNGEALGFTQLDTTTWGLTAYPGENSPNFINAERLLSEPLADGDAFVIDLGTNFRNGEKGISFFVNGNFNPLNEVFNFNVGSGTPSAGQYNVNGNNLNPIQWPYSATSQFRLYYFQYNNNEAGIFLTRGAALTSFETDGALTGFRLYCGNTENQQSQNALLANNLFIYRQIPLEEPTPTLTPTPEPTLGLGNYEDIAENYQVGGPTNNQIEWQNGSNFGSGFGGWTLYGDLIAGRTIVGTSTSSSYGLGNATWCLTGVENNYSNAERSIIVPLTTGDIFEIELGVDFRNGNKGIDLFTNNQFNTQNKLINFRVESDNYYVQDANEVQTQFANWTYGPSSRIKIEIEQRASSLSAVFYQFNSNSTLRNLSSVELPFSSNGTNITGFKLYCTSSDSLIDGGATVQNALLANNLLVQNL